MNAADTTDDDQPDNRRGRASLPPDAVDTPAQQHPHDAAEAVADHDMAVAEEDVSRHAGTPDEVASVEEMATQRGQEDRRRVWMDRHPDTDRG